MIALPTIGVGSNTSFGIFLPRGGHYSVFEILRDITRVQIDGRGNRKLIRDRTAAALASNVRCVHFLSLRLPFVMNEEMGGIMVLFSGMLSE
jgi:hypothetical protein